MSGHRITTFLSLNRNLTSGGGEAREFRLPRMNPFPKLTTRITGPGAVDPRPAAVVRSGAGGGGVAILGDIGPLPEMATDMIDPAAGYAIENVKRERLSSRPWSRVGLGLMVGRMLGGQRAARW